MPGDNPKIMLMDLIGVRNIKRKIDCLTTEAGERDMIPLLFHYSVVTGFESSAYLPPFGTTLDWVLQGLQA